jgi:hypothetical protein
VEILSDFAGMWTGTNRFRLMPSDPLVDSPATVSVTLGAGGYLTTVAYTWAHPDDGPQEGLLTLGMASEEGALVAVWADSWHQQPTAMSLSGNLRDGAVALEGAYGGGWRWRIGFDTTDAGELRMTMDNVIPAEHATETIQAGPYPAMLMALHRT